MRIGGTPLKPALNLFLYLSIHVTFYLRAPTLTGVGEGETGGKSSRLIRTVGCAGRSKRGGCSSWSYCPSCRPWRAWAHGGAAHADGCREQAAVVALSKSDRISMIAAATWAD